MLETCAVCGSEVAFGHTVHVLLNTQDDAGVVDHYVCRSCYETALEPLFAPDDETALDDASGDDDGAVAEPTADGPSDDGATPADGSDPED